MKKKSDTLIYDSIRKPTAPKGKIFKSGKDELPRKAKHKKKVEIE